MWRQTTTRVENEIFVMGWTGRAARNGGQAAGLRSLSPAANMSLSRSVLGASRDGFGRAMPSRTFTRNYMQDLTIKHKTGMPQVTSGPYGLGRYVASC